MGRLSLLRGGFGLSFGLLLLGTSDSLYKNVMLVGLANGGVAAWLGQRGAAFLELRDHGNLLEGKQRGRVLFVTQSFDGIETGGADGGDHPADQAHDGKDEGRDDEGARGDDQADIAGLGVFRHRAIQGQAADRE